MKAKIIATALTLSLAATSANAASQQTDASVWGKYEEQNVGTGLGVLFGAVVAGPFGAIVAGYVGNTIGKAEGEENEIEHLSVTVEKTQEQLAQATEQNAQRDAELVLAKQKLQALEQQYAQRQMDYEKQMSAMHSRTALENALAVSMQFRTGSDTIEPIYQQQLIELAQIMKNMQQYSLDLSGFADRQGEESYNYTLSRKRAEAVKNFLVSQGIDATRITTKAFGETQPLHAEQSLQTDFFDRRVLIKLAPSDTAMAKN